jgi:hypothetical protein
LGVKTFDLEVMFGEHHRGPAGLIGDDGLLAQLLDRVCVAVAIQSPQAFSKVRFRRDGDRIEHTKFHDLPLSRAGSWPAQHKKFCLELYGARRGVNAWYCAWRNKCKLRATCLLLGLTGRCTD